LTNFLYIDTIRSHCVYICYKLSRTELKALVLWVEIVAIAIREYKLSEIEKALDLFPSGLEDIYARISLRIDFSRRGTITKISHWIVVALYPLTLSQLFFAIEVSGVPSVVSLNRDKVMTDQLSYCGDFLTIKNKKSIFSTERLRIVSYAKNAIKSLSWHCFASKGKLPTCDC